MTDSWKKNSWSKDTDILKLCRFTEAYMQQWYLQQCNSLLLHPTSLSYTGHSALVFLILLKIKVRSCYSWAHNPSMASSLLLIQARLYGSQGFAYLPLWFLWLHLIFLSHLWTPSIPGCFSLWQWYSCLRVGGNIRNILPWVNLGYSS